MLVVPVVNDASSLPRYTASAATSSGLPRRCIGWRAMKALRAASRSPVAPVRPASDGESTVRGQTALERTPSPTKPAGTDFVSPTPADWVAPYTPGLGMPLMPDEMDDTLTMAPPPLSSMSGRTE